MKEVRKKNYVLLLGISILCLIVVIVSVTYAYFSPIIEGDGTNFELTAGLIKLQIDEDAIALDGVAPILDEKYSTNASKHEFTVTKTSDSTLKDVCYNLYLYIDMLGGNFYLPVGEDPNDTFQKYLKYRLESNGELVKNGNFSEIKTDAYGEKYIDLASVEQLNKDTTSKDYTLYIWLSYDRENDQTRLLEGVASQRSVSAHLRAIGKTGTCDTTLEIDPNRPVNTTTSRPILTAIMEDNKVIGTRTDFSDTYENLGLTSGLYQETDLNYLESDGRTQGQVLYYVGDVTNNWVKFGKEGEEDIWWRIIRTNEDGSVRLLYAGISSSTEQGYINNTTSKYNDSFNNTRYVGYMYGETGDTLEDNRKNDTDSNIKKVIDEWYEENLLSDYGIYLSKTAIYCNDRATAKYSAISDMWSGTMDYAARTRLDSNKRPSFKCGVDQTGLLYDGPGTEGTIGGADIADRFTALNKSNVGNQKLTYPVALMTADEISYAGGVYGSNSENTYYYKNSNGGSVTGSTKWCTMSPHNFLYGWAYMFDVRFSSAYPGNLNNDDVRDSYGVRPVLSLKSCLSVTGKGTVDDPYIPTEITDACASADN